MIFGFYRAAILSLALFLGLAACDSPPPSGSQLANDGRTTNSHAAAAASRVLNLSIWAGYLAPNTLPDFEKQTGIKVHVVYFDTNETLETRLLAGRSGYDIVVPAQC